MRGESWSGADRGTMSCGRRSSGTREGKVMEFSPGHNNLQKGCPELLADRVRLRGFWFNGIRGDGVTFTDTTPEIAIG